MSPDRGLAPGPLQPAADSAAAARVAARRGAGRLASGFPALGAALLAAFVVGLLIVLDYVFVQDFHRVLKVGAGLVAFVVILAIPGAGMLLLPVVTPFLLWVPPTPIPGLNLINVLLFSIFGTHALRATLQRRPLMRASRLAWPLLALYGLAGLSILRGAIAPTGYAYDPAFAGLALFRALTTIATYFITLSIVNGPRERRRILWAVVAGLLLESVATVILGRTGRGSRAVGSLGQANDLGGYLAVFTVLAAAMMPGVKSWFGRLALLAITGLGSFALLLSLSRGAMVALAAGLLFVTWRGARGMFVALLAVLLLSPVWAPDYLKERITKSAVQQEGGEGVSVDMASQKRLETWQAILSVVTAHPLDGVGFTGLGYVLPDVGAELGLQDIKDSAHNTYLRMLSEMGVFGLALFLWVLWSCLRLANDAVRRARNRFDRAMAIGLGGSVLAMSISCAFGDRFFNPVAASSFWIVCALVEDSLWPDPARAGA